MLLLTEHIGQYHNPFDRKFCSITIELSIGFYYVCWISNEDTVYDNTNIIPTCFQ